ncbi:MAG: sulfite exporter TauE/SafE family protein [Gammaproteobacteria bacterium]|nr:sulfite exporter TauE/SafE family protein [Gammaproteobacteria bacterium]
MSELLSDPAFVAVAVIAVLITGISKGGFGGMALMAVPVMSLVISPIQAAGIVLPLLIPMDIMSIWAYRKRFDRKIIALLLPAATIGITIGALTARWVNDDIVRLIVGIIAIVFVVYRWAGAWYARRSANPEGNAPPKPPNRALGFFLGACSGFTSFLAHAGSPPYQVYVLPQRLPRDVYAGTGIIFFATVNALKLIPYSLVGQFSTTNLSVSAVLLPLVPVGVFIGFWLNRRLREDVFYAIVMTAILLVGIRLIWDGANNVFG